ncbi:hypothetical protein ACHWQZ_G014095 [Mnemiopsis leidyi]
MLDFTGKWKLKDSHLFEDFMADCNVGMLKRQAAKMVSSEHHIVQDGDKMSVNVIATGGVQLALSLLPKSEVQKMPSQKGKQQEYTVGGSFTEQEVTGDTAEVSTEWDGDKIKEIHKSKDFTYTLTRELQDENTMVLHLDSPKGTKAKRIYKKM